MEEMTIKEAQAAVDHWIKTYGVRYFNELTNMTILTEEVGELARIMARTYGEQSFKESDKHRDLGDEMADVLWVLICLECFLLSRKQRTGYTISFPHLETHPFSDSI